MSQAFQQILPSLEAMGFWSYWIIGLSAMLEAFFATGVFIPGSLMVDTGGVLVQQGALDFFDLVWFVAIGSILGGEASYWAGVLARRGAQSRWQPEQSASYRKATALFRRHGGKALVIGRFLGPVSGLVPFAASVAGMERRSFLIWNILSGFPYAFAHVAFGYAIGVFGTSLGPYATRLGLLAIAVLLALVVMWWIIVHMVRLLPLVVSTLTSIRRAIGENPALQHWATVNPRSSAFLIDRFDRTRFFGLTATFLACIAGYILMIWIGSVFDFLVADPILLVDTRLANLIHAFWASELLVGAAYVTALGDWKVVTPLAIAVLTMLIARRHLGLALGLAMTLVGNSVSVALMKLIFHRPRPDLAYFVETSGSFPSGHAAVSVALYGFVFFILWRLGMLKPLQAAICAASIAFVVGLSRIYLIEHFLTDVLNGWLVGALWLVVGITISEWWRQSRPLHTGVSTNKPARITASTFAAILAAVALWQTASYEKARNIEIAVQRDAQIGDVAAFTAAETLPMLTQSIAGTSLEPINIVIVAQDEAAVSTAMQTAHWVRTQNPIMGAVLLAVWYSWTNQGDDTAPVMPYFWRNIPHAFAFQKPTNETKSQGRHHIRFWSSEFVTSDGFRLFVAVASFDESLGWGLQQFSDPDIDTERDRVLSDLQISGAVAQTVSVMIPKRDTSMTDDPWVTDGRARVITLN